MTEETGPAPRSRATWDRRRTLFAVGAAAALVITIVFATVGDGISTDAGGLIGLIINHAHTVVWALLSVALAVAAVRGRWLPPAGALACGALVAYVIFVATVLITD